jgi:rhodanese-related sulfurtransferase
LVICSSSNVFVQKAIPLVNAKFMGRVEAESDEGERWIAIVKDLGATSYDKLALWDVVRKSAKTLLERSVPPPMSRGIYQILADTRSKLQRITPAQALAEIQDLNAPAPVVLVDIRPESQRKEEGHVEGVLVIERNVLEWRFDPRSDARLAIADRYDLRIIIFCQEGYTSSLAAGSLHEIGLLNTTDIVGGFAAWKEAGLPLTIEHRNSTGTM